MSTDPYRIDSDEHKACLNYLKQHVKDLPERMRSVVQRKADAVGSYKYVYYEAENLVYMLEIGSKAFVDARDSIMDKLAPFQNRTRVILPTRLERYIIPEDKLGSMEDAYCILSESRKCTKDVASFTNNRIRNKQSVDLSFFLLEFSKLADVLLEMISMGIYFTDIKESNIMYCEDHLALIDLDSVVLVSTNPLGENVPITMPAAEQFVRLYRLMVTSEGGKQEDDLHTFYYFYTLYAFSVMVMKFYFKVQKKIPLFNSPERYLPTMDAWIDELDNVFPEYQEGKRSIKRLMLLTYNMVRYMYPNSKATAQTLLKQWNEPVEKALSKQQRKTRRKEKRMEKISISIRKPTKLLF